MTNRTSYPTPVDKLLSLGNLHKAKNQWHDYITELGLGSQHIPNLIQMAVDGELYGAESDDLNDNLNHWAPVHAWWALAQLHAEEAIEPLIQLFHEREDSDLVSEEIPKVFGKFGAAAIPPLRTYLADSSHGLFPRITASNSLEEIAKQHPNAQLQSIEALTRQLKLFNQNPEELNGFIVASLTHLQAKESALIIKSAVMDGTVPEDIAGTWDEIKQELGVTEDDLQLLEDLNLKDEQQVGVSDAVSDPVSSVEQVVLEDESQEQVEDIDSKEQHSEEEIVNPQTISSVEQVVLEDESENKVEDIDSKEQHSEEEIVNPQTVSSVEQVVSEDESQEQVEDIDSKQQHSEEEIVNPQTVSSAEQVVSEDESQDQIEDIDSKEQHGEEEIVNPQTVSSIEQVVSEEIEKIETTIMTDDTEVDLSDIDLSSSVEANTEELNTNSVEEVISEDAQKISELNPKETNSQEEETIIANTEPTQSDSDLSVENVSLENVEKVKDITEKPEEVSVKPEISHPAEFKLAIEALPTEKKSTQGFAKGSASEKKSKKRKKKKK